MSLKFFWRLPVEGDARLKKLDLFNLTSKGGDGVGYFPEATSHSQPKRATLTYGDHLARVARAADATGFHGILVPYTPLGEELWILSASLSLETRHVRFVPSFHTATVKPVHAARETATAQRHSNNRFDWNIVSANSEAVQRRDGDFAPPAERLKRTGEFIDIARGVLTQSPFTYQGETYSVENGGLQNPIAGVALPTVYLSGSSEAALALAASRADVYLTWAQPLDQLKERIAFLREAAAGHGRSLRFGLRADVLARPDEEQALFDARRIWESGDRDVLRARQALSGDDIDGGAEERAFAERYVNAGRFEDSLVDRNLWIGEGVVRASASAVIIGSYSQVAERLNAYAEAGIDHFFLAAPPHLEEAYRIGEDLLPLFGSPLAHAAE